MLTDEPLVAHSEGLVTFGGRIKVAALKLNLTNRLDVWRKAPLRRPRNVCLKQYSFSQCAKYWSSAQCKLKRGWEVVPDSPAQSG